MFNFNDKCQIHSVTFEYEYSVAMWLHYGWCYCQPSSFYYCTQHKTKILSYNTRDWIDIMLE